MAFKPTNPTRLQGQAILLDMTDSVTITKYDALVYASGKVLRATSAATEVRYIAMEDKVTGASAGEKILCLPVEWIRFDADTNADPVVATDVWIYADLTDHDTLNESASSTNVFFVESIVWATTDKKVTGYFTTSTS